LNDITCRRPGCVCLQFTRATHTAGGGAGFDTSIWPIRISCFVNNTDHTDMADAARHDTTRNDAIGKSAGSCTSWYIFYDRSCSEPLCACAADNNNIAWWAGGGGEYRARACAPVRSRMRVVVLAWVCVLCVLCVTTSTQRQRHCWLFLLLLLLLFFFCSSSSHTVTIAVGARACRLSLLRVTVLSVCVERCSSRT